MIISFCSFWSLFPDSMIKKARGVQSEETWNPLQFHDYNKLPPAIRNNNLMISQARILQSIVYFAL